MKNASPLLLLFSLFGFAFLSFGSDGWESVSSIDGESDSEWSLQSYDSDSASDLDSENGVYQAQDNSDILEEVEKFIDEVQFKIKLLPSFFKSTVNLDLDDAETPAPNKLLGRRIFQEALNEKEREQRTIIAEHDYRADRAWDNLEEILENMPLKGNVRKRLRKIGTIQRSDDLSKEIKNIQQIAGLLGDCFEELEEKQAELDAQKREKDSKKAKRIKERKKRMKRRDAVKAKQRKNASKGKHLLRTGSAKDLGTDIFGRITYSSLREKR